MPARSLADEVPEEERVTPPKMTEEEMRQEKNWMSEGGVSAIRQQKCGDCYAFSAISALESAYWMKTGRLVPMSEQILVDCSV